jgi:hypothetical protein
MVDSPLFEEYKEKLASLSQNNGNQNLVKVYSYRNHFEELWKFLSPTKPILLVVWDGIPDRESDDEVDTEKHITPIDWAVGFSLHIKNSSLESYPELKILILDEKINRNPNSISLKFVYQSPDKNVISMPWIRIFSLGQNNVLDRYLENFYSDTEASPNSHNGFSRETGMSDGRDEEDKEPTSILSAQEEAVHESYFFGLNIDTIYRNIIRLVDSLLGSVEEVEPPFTGDDKTPEPSHDSRETQTPVSETEICNVPVIPSMKDVLEKNCDLDSTKNLWAASLTSPEAGYHHALANLVGPLLLMDGAGMDLHVTAIQRLMCSIGLLPEKDENKEALLTGKNPWINWDEPEWQWRLKELRKSSNKLKLILIDDMFKSGWGETLCRAVGINYNKTLNKDDGKDSLVRISECQAGEDEKVIVKAASSAGWIISKLNGMTNTDNRFEFSLDDGVGQEILFLDLRLYPGNLSSEIENLFKPLLTLAEKFKEGQNKNLPWNGFTVGDKEGEKGELERIREWIENPRREQEDPEYIEALTLLPRILALTDLSLPIVLFSSTGRRDITEKLKPYGNIITVFEKPRFTVDIPVDIARQTRTKFRDAMEEAFSVLKGRQICRKVKDLAQKAESCDPMIPTGTQIPEFKHIEIYIDESGSPENLPEDQKSFAVGGLIMAYPVYKNVDQLSNELKEKGCYWYSNDENDSNHLSKRPSEGNSKNSNTSWTYDKARGKLLELCNKKKIFISGICVQEKMDDIKAKQTNSGEERHILLKDEQGDERYKRLLTQLLTLALYEYIPALIKKETQITLSIFAGTRTVPIVTAPQGMFLKHDPDDYFGYGYNDRISSYYTIAVSSIHPIVASILRSRKNDLCKELTLHHARGVYLKYGVSIPDKRGREKYFVRNQHYFADNVLYQGGINNVYEKEFKTGFSIQSNMDMDVLLSARKKILDGNTAEGIVRIAGCNSEVVDDKMSGHLIRKIGESLKPEHFDSLKFQNICQLVRLDTTIGNEPSIPVLSKNDIAGMGDSNKVVNDREKIDQSVFRNKEGDSPLNSAILQSSDKTSTEEKKPEETIKKDEKLTLKIVVEDINRVFSQIILYHCRETGGAKRKVLVIPAAVKLSSIDVVSKGDIFEATTYTNDGCLYAANLRKIDK